MEPLSNLRYNRTMVTERKKLQFFNSLQDFQSFMVVSSFFEFPIGQTQVARQWCSHHTASIQTKRFKYRSPLITWTWMTPSQCTMLSHPGPKKSIRKILQYAQCNLGGMETTSILSPLLIGWHTKEHQRRERREEWRWRSGGQERIVQMWLFQK